jgi:large subunit ribosomal protein L3
MGSERVTVQRLKVVEARPDENLLFISGAVPGATGSFVTVRKSKKS